MLGRTSRHYCRSEDSFKLSKVLVFVPSPGLFGITSTKCFACVLHQFWGDNAPCGLRSSQTRPLRDRCSGCGVCPNSQNGTPTRRVVEMQHRWLCPRCGGTNVRRSHRKGLFERAILSLLHLRPYRCEECDKRFFGGQVSVATQRSPAPPRIPRSPG